MQTEGSVDQFVLPEDTRFLLPLQPGKILALGRNYAAHAAEGGYEVPDEPVVFCKAPTACIGDGQPIVLKEAYGRVDHEAEIAVVIARRCKEASVEEAGDYIAGYTILNDVTARGMQKADIAKGLPWFRSKSIDTFCPLGPAIVLFDGMPDPFEIDLELRVNGEVRQRGNTRQLVFSVPEIVSHLSRLMTLEPGDVIATGTPEGIAPINPGDVVEIEAPGVGILSNPVVEERRKRYGVPRSAVGGQR
ncbi:MAG: fumarylacetoacetate hydrolase family protein [bacterium]|nr:fumarylacetoacetate hydrolase family protein [bacterium]